MKHLISFLSILSVFGCASNDKNANKPTDFQKKNPVVTIETSGDLYFEENGKNIQMDLFGNCSPGKSQVYISIDRNTSISRCKDGRYRYSMNLPESFFESKENSEFRTPSSKYLMKEISVYHQGHKNLRATSYILIDRKRKEVRSVINKQTKFEKIPTGEYEPVTQYNAFGSCAPGTTVKIDVKSPDRFGHLVSKYDETKKCQDSGGYYFLSQIDGHTKKGTIFKVFVDRKVEVRKPASVSDQYRYKNVLDWTVPIK